MDKSHFIFDKSLLLKQIPFFSGLNFFEKRIVIDSLEVIEFRKSQIIYSQEDPPDAFYCIISGRVQTFIRKGHQEETLEYLYRGKYFGFISLLTSEPHSVSARAVNDTIVVKIQKEKFNAILKSVPRLAIELSQMLSRRLKTKNLHAKSIFESTIIAVYGDPAASIDSSRYVLNLALDLRNQTNKKVILVEVANSDSIICDALSLDLSVGLIASEKLFPAEGIFNKILHNEKGIDVLRIFPAKDKEVSAGFLVSLLTMLVNDYHYCLLRLVPDFGPEVFKVLSQGDIVHILAGPDIESLKKMYQAMESYGAWADKELKRKIKLIILEESETHGKGSKLSGEQEAALFHQPIFATLPYVEDKKPFFISADYADPYSKAIRRISRQLGEVLVGLALGCGSAMGLAHIGVLKVLEYENVPIDIVSGSSMGAFIGALWCCGYSALEVEEIILSNKNQKYLFGFEDITFPIHGMVKGGRIKHFLNRYLKDKTFSDIKRPFKIVACDCISMKQVVFDSGRLVDAILASISIPGVFVPYKIGSHYYIDGGILNPLPTSLLVEAGAKKIIAVNVLPSSDEIERTYELLVRREENVDQKWHLFSKIKGFYRKKASEILKPNIFDVIVSCVQSMEYQLALISSLSQSDVTLHPDMTAVSWSEFQNASDLIKRGEEEAQLHLDEIKALISLPD